MSAELMLSIEVTPNGCWAWTGRLDRDGYGRFRGALAHRVSYEFVHGPLDDGFELDHTCRLRSCINPAHLEPVTHAENLRRVGEAITHCKNGHEFTPENTYTIPTRKSGGRRQRRTCNRRAARRSRERRTA